MAKDLKLQDGTQYIVHYDWEPGMNDDVMMSDRAGFTTSVEMLTTGRPEDWGVFGGPEVGNQYDLDPMGEERGMTTFSRENPQAKGMIGMMATEGGGMDGGVKATTVGGKSTDLAPQTYNRIGMKSKG